MDGWLIVCSLSQIDLLDPSVKLTFHDEKSLLTISSHGRDTILDCRTSAARDEWLNALVSAQDHAFSEAEHDSDNEESGDDEDAQADDMEALQALEDSARASMLQSQLSMIIADEDDAVDYVSNTSGNITTQERAQITDTKAREQCIQAIVSFIETTANGGRAILLHLGVLTAAGIALEDVLTPLGVKQRRSSCPSTTLALERAKGSQFVRDMIFHPVYSKRPEVNTDPVNALIDRYFSHCRLRRFSQENQISSSPQADTADSALPPKTTAEESVTTVAAVLKGKKKKRHSFPNLLTSLGFDDKSHDIRAADSPNAALLPTPNSCSTDHGTSPITSGDSELFMDESIVEPLRSLVWRYSCLGIAEQITRYHHQKLSKIHLWDFLHLPRAAGKLIADRFNCLVGFFVWSVLVEDTPKDRAEVIEQIIGIAAAAASPPLNNFHLVMACVGCLGDAALMTSRLPMTWKKVAPKVKTQLRDLRRLCDHTGGFETLRRRQMEESAKASSLCIPFIGVIGVALERLRMASYFNEHKQLNLDKVERQYLALMVLEQAIQRSSSKIARVDHVESLLEDLDMGFAPSRVLQLRSQQIIAIELILIKQIGTRHGSFGLPLLMSSSSCDTVTTTSVVPGAKNDVSSPAFLSFRNICRILVSVADPIARVNIGIESLLADDRQHITQTLRTFWLDFKQNITTSPCMVALHGVRTCIDELVKEILVQKRSELLLLSGLTDSNNDGGDVALKRMVYTKVATMATQPIWTWIVRKADRAMVTENSQWQAALDLWKPPNTFLLSSAGQTAADVWLHMLDNCSSPMDLLVCLTSLQELLVSMGLTSMESQTEALLSLVQQHNQLQLRPMSLLHVLQQTLDVSCLSQTQQQSLELLGQLTKLQATQ